MTTPMIGDDRKVHRGVPAVMAVLAWAGIGHAERPRIAVEHARADAAARRVFAEMRNAGLDPVDVHAQDGAGGPSQLADRYGAIAVLSIKRPNRIELAVLSPETREVIYESTVTSKGGTPASVRAAEELHGRLIDLPRREASEGAAPADAAPAPHNDVETVLLEETPDPTPAPKSTAAPELSLDDKTPRNVGRDTEERQGGKLQLRREDRPAFWLGGGAGVTSTVSGQNRAPVVKLEARFEPMRYFAISAFGLLPVRGQDVQAQEGSADLQARLVGGMLHATVLNVADVFRVSTGAGGGAAIVTMSGRASTPNLAGRTTSAATGVGMAQVAVSARLFPWLALRVDANVGLAAYRPVMRFDGREVATWGPSTMAFTGGLEVDALGFGSAPP